jgi:hypothetical protein
MRLKNTFLVIGLLISISGFTQNEQQAEYGNHEIKLNLLYGVLESASLEYEYIINSDITVGLGASYFFDISSSEFEFIAVPNARFYPGNQERASSFFTELSVPVYPWDEREYNWTTMQYEENVLIGVGVGVTAGYKLISKKAFVTELFFGVGRNFNNDINVELFSRAGITFGKRF